LTNELVYGLQVAVEAAALATINGSSGIMTQAYNTSVLATLRKSLTVLESQGYTPGFMLLNPGDWEGVELALASTNASNTRRCPTTQARGGCSARRWSFRPARHSG
jgi:hypothetical protein